MQPARSDANRYMIVNADDFGQSPGVNQGVMKAHEDGIVTSASLMIRWPAAREASAYSEGHPDLSLGLHADLGEWARRDGAWVPLYEVTDIHDETAVREELRRQLRLFRFLTGTDPTHLDSHQHVHRHEPVRSVLLDVARTLRIPLRHYCPEIRYCGAFYGQTATGTSIPHAISCSGLIALLTALTPTVTELSCHPANGDDLNSTYRMERSEELRTLCSPHVRAAIDAEGIELCSFLDVATRFGPAVSQEMRGAGEAL